MAKTKIFELKNIINEQINGMIESKDIQDFLEKSMGVKKTHSSNLEDNEIEAVKKHYLPQTAKTDTFQNTSGNSGKMAAGKAEPGSVRAKAAQDGTKSMSASQSQQTSQMKHNESGMRPTPDGGQKPAMGSNPRTAGEGNIRTSGQSGTRPAGQGQVRPGSQSYSGNQASHNGGLQHNGQTARTGAAMRPMGEAGQRPAADGSLKTSGQSGMRQSSQGYQGNQAARNGAVMHNGQAMHGGVSTKPQNYTGNQPAHNTAMQHGGQAAHNTLQRQTGEGNFRPMGENSQRPAADGSIRTAGQNSMRQGNQGQGYRQSGNQTNQRPAGNQAGQTTRNTSGQRSSGEGYQRQSGEGYQRPSGEGYQRPSGQNGMRQGYQGQRSSGEGYQRTNNQTGMRQGGQGGQQNTYGQRYQSQGNQNRQTGSDQGYTRSSSQGNRRPDGSYNQNRPRPYSQDGTRPQGGRYSGQDGQRSYNNSNQGNYQRSGQQGNNQRAGGGYNQRGFENFQKDEDDKPNYGNRSQTGNKRSPGGARNNERKNFDQQILDQKVAEKNDYSNKRNRDRISKEKTYKDRGLVTREDFDNEDETNINKISHKKGQFIQPKPVEPEKEEIKEITIPEVLTIKELAEKMKMPSSVLIKKLFLAGKIVTVNQEITYEEASEIALEYDIIAEKEVKVNEVEELLKDIEDAPETLVKRPPVVCVMGHVDHGKTSLLDAIRQTNVTAKEAGGITQHIGAYMVDVNGEKITFLDTPGHEAFTAMRKRGAQATDIAILVVAADDGVMPQTVEAISHAKAANVQIIVAVNKIDKPSANVERVKQELTEYGLVAEDWGGDTVFAPVSAHTKEGLDHLLEMILLTAEMDELKANPNRNARGLVIEAELDKGRGPVATILVQKGTLKVGDNVAIGSSFGKVRAMTDDKGRRVKEATPSMPVEILGLNDVPDVGEIFVATDNEKEARVIAEAFISRDKVKLIDDTKAKLSLDGLFSQIKAGNIKELNLIIKADVQGSVEAMRQSLLKLSNDEVAVRILHGGVGAINESDVILASTSNAIIIGFNVKPDNAAKETADREKTDIRLYRVIYNAIDDVEAAMKGLLDPIYEERIIGHAEIRQTFKASGVGTIAGSYVLDGKVVRGCKARIYRGTSLIFEGALTSLKRFQDDVKEVAAGYECGLVLDKFNDIKEGDKAELYIMAEVPR